MEGDKMEGDIDIVHIDSTGAEKNEASESVVAATTSVETPVGATASSAISTEPANVSPSETEAPKMEEAKKLPEKLVSSSQFDDMKRESKLDSIFKIGQVPFHRRRETLTLVMFFLAIWISALLSIILLRSNGLFLYVFLLYIGYMILYQDFHRTGGLKKQWFVHSAWWKWFRNYFPIQLHKTVDLDPTKTYIFGYHPHGIISLGAFINFATEATYFSKLFPGINNRLLTLETNFRVPFYGLYLSFLGICGAGKESCNYVLSRGGGNSITLVLGGAKESLEAHPGKARLYLKTRKGFVKIGLTHGACLVPCYSFGENEIYNQVENPKGSILRKIQDRLQDKMGFALPLVKGRGIFNYTVGLLPQRKPINTVVGTPIQLPKIDEKDITPQDVDHWHAVYMKNLQELFETYKSQFSAESEHVEFE